jgi:hypothetical protein
VVVNQGDFVDGMLMDDLATWRVIWTKPRNMRYEVMLTTNHKLTDPKYTTGQAIEFT